MTEISKAHQSSFTGWPGAEPSPIEDSSDGRFKKGTSGNPKGRPIKAVRAATIRGMHRDIIEEAERPIEVNGEKVPAMRLIFRTLVHYALKGDRSALTAVLKLNEEAVRALAALNPEEHRHLEVMENYVKDLGSAADNRTLKMLNNAREKAKRI